MEFLLEYAGFLLKTITVLVAVVIIIGAIAGSVARGRHKAHEQLTVERLNDRFDDMRATLRDEIEGKKAAKLVRKQLKKTRKHRRKGGQGEVRQRLFVLDFEGDIRASAVENLREEVNALLTVIDDKDEVIVRLDSPGGMVHAYGLAASQLARIRDRHIKLVVAVDQVAASGGYLMACVADRIVAAPFAIIGSIGVVGQLPNFHRLLKQHHIDYEQHTAGEYKRTLTVLGENTEAGRQKFKEELEGIHSLFKGYIQRYRRRLDVDKVATGEYWLGEQAKELGLVDDLLTSDDYLFQASERADIYRIRFERKQSIGKRLSLVLESVLGRALGLFNRHNAAA